MKTQTIAVGDALEELIDHRGRTPKKLGGDWADQGVRVVSAINIKAGRVTNENLRWVPEELAERWMSVPLEGGDVLLTSEAPLGEVAYLHDDVDWCLGQRLFGLRGRDGVLDGRFLYYLLRFEPVKHELLSRATGTTATGIRQAELVKVELSLPSIEDQQRIAGRLGILDDKIDANVRLSRVLQDLARAHSELLLDDAGDAELQTIADLVDHVRDLVKPEELEDQTRYVGLEHMPRGSLVLDSWGSAEGLASGKARFTRGDILFGKLRPYFRKVAVAPFDGVCSTDILVLRPKRPEVASLAALVVSSQEVIDAVSAGASGTRMPRTSWRDVGASVLPVPTDAALTSFASTVDPMLNRALATVAENESLALLRDSLSRKLLSPTLQKDVVREGAFT